MPRYADPLTCPGCRTPLPTGARRCPACGLDLADDLAAELFQVLSTADGLLARMQERRLAAARGAPSAPARSAPGSTVSTPTGPVPAGTVPEGSGAYPSFGVPRHPGDAGADDGPGVRASTVPKILLTLGAVCLLAAGAVFLAVTWSTLGIGGRTAVLVGVTLAMTALTAWSARRGFRGAVEALGLVSIGLLVLDLVGAEQAGWLGSPSDATFTTGAGLLLVVVGVAASWASRRTPAGTFTGAEIVAMGAALAAVAAAQRVDDRHPVLPMALVLLLLGGATVLALALDVTGAAAGVAAVASLGWVVLLVTAAEEAAQGGETTLTSMWAAGGAVGLVVVAGLSALVAVPPAVPQRLRTTAASATSVALAAVVVLPALDNGVRSVTVVAIAVALLAAAALVGLVRVAPAWAGATAGLLALASATLALHAAGWALGGLEAYGLTAARSWSGRTGGPVEELPPFAGLEQPWLLPVAVATLAVVVLALETVGVLGTLAERSRARLAGTAPPAPPGQTDSSALPASSPLTRPSSAPPTVRPLRPLRPRRAAALVAGPTVASVPLAALGFPVPVWSVLVLLLGTAVAVAAVAPRLSGSRAESYAGALAATVLLAAAQPLSWYDETLTGATLLVTLLVGGVVHHRSTHAPVSAASGAVVVATLAGLAWTVGAILELPEPETALTATGLTGLLAVLGPLTGLLRRDGLPRLAVELAAVVAAVPLLLLGVEAADRPATWAAVHLTVLGVLVVALSLLRPDRRPVAALGGLLLAGATWLRLGDLGVSEPEPYTLPSAVALLLVGWWQLHRRPGLSTRRALGPGLLLALVPSLLWVLAEDSPDLRVLLLGTACLALVLGGTVLRWSAPLVLGAAVGVVVAVQQSAPYVDAAVPRWGLLGAAGGVLVAVALTWESRRADARRAAAYLDRLR